MALEDYDRPSLSVDTVVFSVRNGRLRVLLIKRGVVPFKDKWAIPGGFIGMDETLDEAAERELSEETGVENVYLEQLYTFGNVKRDPRGRVVSVAYMALINSSDFNLKSGTDAAEARWFDVKDLPEVGFDHKKILSYALKRLRWKFEYTAVGFSLLPKKFKLSELLNLYNVVFDKEFDKRNFSKKLHALKILRECGVDRSVPYRPPKLYSLKSNVPDVVGII